MNTSHLAYCERCNKQHAFGYDEIGCRLELATCREKKEPMMSEIKPTDLPKGWLERSCEEARITTECFAKADVEAKRLIVMLDAKVNAAGIGLQRGPASVPQINAQVKQTKRELEPTMSESETKERPDEVGFWRLEDGGRLVEIVRYETTLMYHEGTLQEKVETLPCGKWERLIPASPCPHCAAKQAKNENSSALLARQADELLAAKEQLRAIDEDIRGPKLGGNADAARGHVQGLLQKIRDRNAAEAQRLDEGDCPKCENMRFCKEQDSRFAQRIRSICKGLRLELATLKSRITETLGLCDSTADWNLIVDVIKAHVIDRSTLRSQMAGVQGALTDAGDVLCQREDGDYGASVRQVVEQRDSLKSRLAEVEMERDGKIASRDAVISGLQRDLKESREAWEALYKTAVLPLQTQKKAAEQRVETAEICLRTILGWNCLHPEPAVHLCADLPWLKGLIQAALATITGEE